MRFVYKRNKPPPPKNIITMRATKHSICFWAGNQFIKIIILSALYGAIATHSKYLSLSLYSSGIPIIKITTLTAITIKFESSKIFPIK